MYISTCCMVKNDFGSFELIGKLYLSKDKQTYIDFDSKEIVENGNVVSISPITYNLLEYLICNYDKTITRELLVEHLWPNIYPDSCEQQISNSISTLRNFKNHDYLSNVFKKIIETKHGIGYKCQLGTDIKILHSAHKKTPYFNIGAEFINIENDKTVDFIDIYSTTSSKNSAQINDKYVSDSIETIIANSTINQNVMENFYNILIETRNSLRECDESAINLNFKNLQDCVQRIYYIAERYKYSDKNKSKLANLIVNKYNDFVTALNDYVNSRNESESIINKKALEAEQKFYELLDLVLRILK